MAAPNLATIASSLERLLENCSLNQGDGSSPAAISGIGLPENQSSGEEDDAVLELNSHVPLPHDWEQCLDLKTGEIYYINWRNGMRATEDPRSASPEYSGGDYYYYSEDDSSYDSEESSSESSPFSGDKHFNNVDSSDHRRRTDQEDGVLVVAGCKSCFMYFMVPKPVGDCPKCTGQLLHFDHSDDSSS